RRSVIDRGANSILMPDGAWRRSPPHPPGTLPHHGPVPRAPDRSRQAHPRSRDRRLVARLRFRARAQPTPLARTRATPPPARPVLLALMSWRPLYHIAAIMHANQPGETVDARPSQATLHSRIYRRT